MKKEGRIFLTFVLAFVSLVFFTSSVVAYDEYVNATNISIRETYQPYDLFSGTFYLTLRDIEADAKITTNLGQEISLREFLEDNGLQLSCESFDCLDMYESSGSGQTTKTISVSSSPREVGLELTGNGVSVSDIDFDFVSDFGKGNSIPLKIDFFDEYNWEYDEFSDDFSRRETWGCFVNSSASYNKFISASTRYCEKVSLLESNKFLLGADFIGTDNKDLIMTLFDSNFLEIENCNFSSSSADKYCIIETDTLQQSGDYYACINAESIADSDQTAYKLAYENTGTKCGWYGNPFSQNSTGDYGIYVKLPKYDELIGSYNFSSTIKTAISNSANTYLLKRYGGTCEGGCVLPIKFSGVNQELILNNLEIDYSQSSGASSSDKFYEVTKEKTRANFSGNVDISKSGFKVATEKSKIVKFYLENGIDELLFETLVRIKLAPIIYTLYPSKAPAGVDVLFYLDFGSSKNISSVYWDFGDSTTDTTTGKKVVHKYDNISRYDINVKVTDINGSYSEKNFTIITESPKNIVNSTLSLKRGFVNSASQQLNALLGWKKVIATDKVGVSQYVTDLNKIESNIRKAVSDSDYLKVASDLYGLVVPRAVYVSESVVEPLIANSADILPEAVEGVVGGGEGDLSDYKQPIINWQIENIIATKIKETVSIEKDDGETEDLFTYYRLSIKSNSNKDTYFVIQKPEASLNFKTSENVRESGANSVIILKPEETKELEFYVSGSEDLIMFVSPKLSYITITEPVGPCNYNKQCEKSLDETWKNCRSDCKPVGLFLLWLVILLLVFLIVYTLLQQWYKRKYEEYLFHDRTQLYNLVMFINNAKTGMSYEDIEKKLTEKGWSGEQINYTMKKAQGKRTGMFEIIPVDWVVSRINQKKAQKKKYPAPTNYQQIGRRNIATPFGQKNKPNFNKRF